MDHYCIRICCLHLMAEEPSLSRGVSAAGCRLTCRIPTTADRYCIQIIDEGSTLLKEGVGHRLPSFNAEFTASTPLTRIRDIAHRSDIPHELKQEIKHTIQVASCRSSILAELCTPMTHHGGWSRLCTPLTLYIAIIAGVHATLLSRSGREADSKGVQVDVR